MIEYYFCYQTSLIVSCFEREKFHLKRYFPAMTDIFVFLKKIHSLKFKIQGFVAFINS